MSVTICIRFKPGERSPHILVDNNHIDIKASPEVRVHDNAYNFHHVFSQNEPNTEIFDRLQLLTTIFEGFNLTVMAYGQTGSGKTYTMMGSAGGDTYDTPGIIPLLLKDLFDNIRSRDAWRTNVRLSFVQVYMEKIYDLFGQKNVPLHLKEKITPNNDHEIYVKDVVWKSTKNEDEALQHIKEGNTNRFVSSTDMNQTSSRSHAVVVMEVEQTNWDTGEKLISRIHLVDLAGSETVRKTHAEGLTLQQACHVNKSLTTLNTVIQAVVAKKSHVPFRDSKLTRMLTNSLGGNSKTVMILACSSEESNLFETNSTLQFGKRALDLPNKAKVNKILTIDDYKRMVERTEKLLEKQKLIIRALEKENKRLQTAEIQQIEHKQPETIVEETESESDAPAPRSFTQQFLTPTSRQVLRSHIIDDLQEQLQDTQRELRDLENTSFEIEEPMARTEDTLERYDADTETHTLDIVFIVVGSAVLVTSLALMFVIKYKFGGFVAGMWGVWVAAVVGAFFLGWGVPHLIKA